MGADRERRGPSFASIERDTLNSSVWKKGLKWYEMLAYLYFKKNYSGFNNGNIELRYSEMKGVMSSSYFKMAKDGLISKGWIEVIEPGGKFGNPAKFRLTGRHEKIIEGKLNKFFAEKCLLSQPFVKDDSKTVGQALTDAAKAAGGEAKIKRFIRIEIA